MRSVFKAFQYGLTISAACVVLLFVATEAFADRATKQEPTHITAK